MYEHNALGYWSGLTLCLTKVRSSRARCPATALIYSPALEKWGYTGFTLSFRGSVVPWFRDSVVP